MYWPMLRPFGRKSELAVGDNDPFTALRRELDRLFDSFGRDVGWPAEGSRAAAMTPSIDVTESEGELKIDVDLPGVEEKDVDVAISDNVLTIKGEKKAEREEKKRLSPGGAVLRLALALAHAAVRGRPRPGQGDLQERRAVDQPAEAARSPGQGEEDRDQCWVRAPLGREPLPASGGPRRRAARLIARPGCRAGLPGGLRMRLTTSRDVPAVAG